ncbi:SPL family radical SAM protein [Haladaptatus salinisoli]|uniref:SPL family radical SAM protein n=1 Tax=Haladaptatus salinisoli TaxID=2884876 RepID=UPI003F6280B6
MDEKENTVESLGSNPSLITLRNAEQEYGERIDLWQAGLLCSDCGNEINGRFGSTPSGDLLCWECAIDAQSDEENQLTVNTDPTKATISESHLHEKSLCDYVVNVATGCRHGCKFCYVPSTPGVSARGDMLDERAEVEDVQRDWGSYLLYRDDLPERLHTELETKDYWKHTEGGRGVVMLSSGTDCYQDRRAAQITRGCIAELAQHGRPVRILTRSPAVVRDIDLFKEYKDLITVGSSIPSLDDDLVRTMEPNAPPPSARWETLDRLRKEGVRRFVSMSPTYPTMGEDEFWNVLTFLKALDPEVIFHEPINPRGENFQMCLRAAKEAGRDALADELEKLTNHQNWIEYAIEQIDLVQRLADEIGGLQIHSWPDRELIQSTTGELRFKLNDMKDSVSPEQFGEEPVEESESQCSLVEDPKNIRSQIRS